MFTVEDLTEFSNGKTIDHLGLFILSTTKEFVWHIEAVGDVVGDWLELYVRNHSERNRLITRHKSTPILFELSRQRRK